MTGLHTHGQLLIYHDAFGLYPRFKPRMAKAFAGAGKMIEDGVHQYVLEDTEHQFHQPKNRFRLPDDECEKLIELLEEEEG